MIYYKQTKAVSWLKSTTAGTVWVSTFDNYIQPEDETLRTTPLGVDLSLLDDESLSLFVPVRTLSLEAEPEQLNIVNVMESVCPHTITYVEDGFQRCQACDKIVD